MNREIALELKNLVFSYRPESILIEQMNLALFKGEAAALVGPNGAGKTTLGKLMAGILKPSSGQLIIFGEEGKTLPLHRIAQRVGYCFQNPEHQLLAVSVEDEIAFGLKYRSAGQDHISRVTESLLKLFEIERLRKAFPLNLSWGEKRRVVLAASLALDPEFIILDEPTNGLDDEQIETLNRVLGGLHERGIGVLLISHNQSFVEINAQRILQMEEGKIVNDYCL